MSRNNQFIGFAHLLLEELKPDLTMLFTELRMNYPSRSDTGIEHAEEIIEKHVAQRAYDLVMHTLRSILRNDNGTWKPEYMGPYRYIGFNSMHDDGKIEQYLKELLAGIVDMEELPEGGNDVH